MRRKQKSFVNTVQQLGSTLTESSLGSPFFRILGHHRHLVVDDDFGRHRP